MFVIECDVLGTNTAHTMTTQGNSRSLILDSRAPLHCRRPPTHTRCPLDSNNTNAYVQSNHAHTYTHVVEFVEFISLLILWTYIGVSAYDSAGHRDGCCSDRPLCITTSGPALLNKNYEIKTTASPSRVSGGDAVVSRARDPIWRRLVLCRRGHVVGWLHLCRDVGRETAFPGHVGAGPVAENISVSE